jgi:hypothetical protein
MVGGTSSPVDRPLVVRVDDRNEADRILGEDWMDPRHALLVKALEAHPERGSSATATGDGGARRAPLSLCRQLEQEYTGLHPAPSFRRCALHELRQV